MQPPSSTPPAGETPGGDRITIVSGLPRSGTSMMMSMLGAGGMPLLTDASRPPDINNPGGYFEYAPARAIARDASWMGMARGRAVKVISFHLFDLPGAYEYDVVLMRRTLGEIVASQRAFAVTNGPELPPGGASALYENHVRHLDAWLACQARIRVLRVAYTEVIAHAAIEARRVAEFLAQPLDIGAMAASVRPELYRRRQV